MSYICPGGLFVVAAVEIVGLGWPMDPYSR